MVITCYKTVAAWACVPQRIAESGISSDGDGGPDDGTNHVHPEGVFHADLHSCALFELHHH